MCVGDWSSDVCSSDLDQGTKLGVFCTGPSIANTGLNLLSEIIGTFVLVFAILGIGNVENAGSMGLNYFFVFAIIVSIGMSLGGLTGYAINPARDLGPRLAHAVLPIPGKGDSNFGYAWIPVVGPIIGALLAGRDKGQLFFVVDTDEQYVYLADGKGRRLESPKRKKRRHVRKLPLYPSRVAEKLRNGDKVLNSELRRELAVFGQTFNSQNQGG